MPRVIHFEIVANNPKRAIEFYKEVFGWEFNQWNGPQEYWLVKTGEGQPARHKRRTYPENESREW